MELELRRSEENDLGSLADIYVGEFSKPPYNENWEDGKAARKMNFYHEFRDLYSICDGKEVLGFAAVNSDFMCPGEVAFVEELCVKSEAQGSGVGTWAIGELMKEYSNRGFKRFMGIANVDSREIKLYERLGILPSESDVLIEKRLGE